MRISDWSSDVCSSDLIEEGYLYIRDRLKDMVRSGGENVYPAEVERHLTNHPDIVEAIVFGVPDRKWGEAVHALVILRKGADLTEDDVLGFARNGLAQFKCPRRVEFASALPRPDRERRRADKRVSRRVERGLRRIRK